MDLDIQGLRVLITAGASGIGLATARAFTREGARVVICDVDRNALRSVRRGQRSCAFPGVLRRVRFRRGWTTVRDRAPGARRPRYAGQQCRHRGTHCGMRGHRACRLAAHPRGEPYGAICSARSAQYRCSSRAAIPALPTCRRPRDASGFLCRTPYAAWEDGG